MSSSLPKRLEDLSLVRRDRLVHIDLRLHFFGEIGRPDLIERFGMTPAGTTRDLALYREIVPHNITFGGNNKIYRIGQEPSPLFEYTPLRILPTLSLGFGDGVNGSTQTPLSCESPATLNTPKMDVLAMIYRGTHTKRSVAVRYHSISSGESKRTIVPLALVDTGLRWHVWVFGHKSREFRGFVVTRIEEPTLFDEESQASERSRNDIQWTCIVELDFVPHPSVERPDITKIDYGMTDGSIRMRVRAAVVGHMLQHRRVNYSPGRCLRGSEYRLWLEDHPAIYGVKNISLVPSYRATEKVDY